MMAPSDFATLLWTHLSLSPFSVGGAMTVAPELHRILVEQHAWLSDQSFTRCIALAQAMPGPNVLYIALLGWTVGLQGLNLVGAGPSVAWLAAPLGLVCSLVGILLPSSVLACGAGHLLQRWSDHPAVRALRSGMEPIVVAALLSSACAIGKGVGLAAGDVPALALAALAVITVVCTRVHLLWILLVGALSGALTSIGGLGLQ